MNIERGSIEHIAKEYEDMEGFNKDIEKVFKGETTGMYARYDYEKLADDEKNFAEMIGVPDTAIFNSGMAAIHCAIESEELKLGDIIMCSEDVYGVTKDYVSSLEKRGVRVEYFDPSDIEGLEERFKRENPRLLIAETISNTKDMKVADIEKYAQIVEKTGKRYEEEKSYKKVLEKFVEGRKDMSEASDEFKAGLLSAMGEYKKSDNYFVFKEPIKRLIADTGLPRKEAIDLVFKAVKNNIRTSRDKVSMIIDNTLPSPVLINPVKEVGKMDVDMTVVESGTKHFQGGKNKITSGLVYSKDAEKMKQIKELRIQTGAYLQATSEAEIPENVVELMQGSLKRHAKNALELAKELQANGFEVYHPNLDKHKQSELVNKLAPEGSVTLFYIDIPESIKNRDEFMDEVKLIGGDKIGLGSSFGHNKTWLSNFALEGGTIRIAVGNEKAEDFEEVLKIFKEAADKLKSK